MARLRDCLAVGSVLVFAACGGAGMVDFAAASVFAGIVSGEAGNCPYRVPAAFCGIVRSNLFVRKEKRAL